MRRERKSFVALARSFLVSILCAVALLFPHEAECGRKDKKKTEEIEALERRKKEDHDKFFLEKLQEAQEERESLMVRDDLTPKELKRKIAIIRKHISGKRDNEKRVLLEVFDDLCKTPEGRHLLCRVPSDLSIIINDKETAIGRYGCVSHIISVNPEVFREMEKKNDEFKYSLDSDSGEPVLIDVGKSWRKLAKLALASTIAHEMSHAEQDMFYSIISYRLDKPNCSYSEVQTSRLMIELHPLLIETVVACQLMEMPKYEGSIGFRAPANKFFYELKKAKMMDGADAETAERFARSVFVETFWTNNQKKPIYVGNSKIKPPAGRMVTWHGTYNRGGPGAGVFVGFDKNSFAKEDSGDTFELEHYIDLMRIDTPASFFLNPETRPFRAVSNYRYIQYQDGIEKMIIDRLDIGCIVKVYNSDGRMLVVISKPFPSRKSELRKYTHVEKYDSGKVRATYSCNSAGMCGTYCEFDKHGRQIMELPLRQNVVVGTGWVLEDGKRVKKEFVAGGRVKGEF